MQHRRPKLSGGFFYLVRSLFRKKQPHYDCRRAYNKRPESVASEHAKLLVDKPAYIRLKPYSPKRSKRKHYGY